MRIFIAGSASNDINKKYFKNIDKIARYIVDNNHKIIFIGCSSGTIGELFKNVKKLGGVADVIVPEVYAHEATDDDAFNSKIVVDNLYTVQQLFLRNSDLTIVFPGGNGTLAELFMITDNIKSKHDTDPVLIMNTDGFYDKVKDVLTFMHQAGAMTKSQLEYFTFCNTAEELNAKIGEIANSKKK